MRELLAGEDRDVKGSSEKDMLGWQLWRCCRPRPIFVILVVAVCLSYQSLTLLGRKIFTFPRTSHTKLERVVSTNSMHCLFTLDNLHTAEEIEDSILKHLDDQYKRRAVLYVHRSIGRKERQLYQRILTKQGYTATILEDNEGLKPEPSRGNTKPWDLLLCIHAGAANDKNCLDKNVLLWLQPHQKVNLIPELQDLLCRKEGLCQLSGTFPELRIPVSPSVCTGHSAPAAHDLSEAGRSQRNAKSSPAAELKDWSQPGITPWDRTLAPGLQQRPVQSPELSALIKAYVLVTSLTPLRAFIHSTGAVWHPPDKRYFSIKLWAFFEKFFEASSAMEAFENMKDIIIKVLLAAEVLSEKSTSGPNPYKRCSQCFQLLTFHIGFSSSLSPLVLEVRDHFDFHVDNEQIYQDQGLKEWLLGEALSMLTSNLSVDPDLFQTLRNMHRSLVMKDVTCRERREHCLSLEELQLMIYFIKELNSLGQFELLFPSPAPKLQALLHQLYCGEDALRNPRSVPALHLFLSNVLQHFQVFSKQVPVSSRSRNHFRGKQTRRQEPSLNQNENRIAMTKDITCSNDRDVLSHIRQIFTSPRLDLSPEFNPRIKEYYSEVPFDFLTVVIGAEASHCECRVHLDERTGPRFANYPLGLGVNQIILLVTDEAKVTPQVVSRYKVTIYREERPSMPLFDVYTMCSFVQDCGLIIQPEESCGLQPLSPEYLASVSQAELKTCKTGDEKGQWIVPCLSCSDNRTCDWRAIAWQPYSCQYTLLTKPQLQRCVAGRKVLHDAPAMIPFLDNVFLLNLLLPVCITHARNL
ncbi:cadherin-like and PC-esterase domain-containing protein 1 isoform X2 [Microcaecilia unicolor]|uniref:Cadherin-like and PC-esterase domain-containing protein 1 isoform X2 n=1 Tax=Microcaecilia unicolor TaxID=1415580 RepID=A0A6P7YZ86_9AMPH|nr:cadherin-like and PC-esterase domain-containing protein 1 isoform X2 [Microcaecilia unicolor]